MTAVAEMNCIPLKIDSNLIAFVNSGEWNLISLSRALGAMVKGKKRSIPSLASAFCPCATLLYAHSIDQSQKIATSNIAKA
jgi:hypothetical protein